jgi:hypothetical protein
MRFSILLCGADDVPATTHATRAVSGSFPRFYVKNGNIQPKSPDTAKNISFTTLDWMDRG